MEKVAKWIAIGALFIIPFLPLYVESSLYFPYISGKGFAFRILVEIAFGAWVLLFFTSKKYRPTFSWTAVALTAFVFWMLIADLFGVNPVKAFWSNFERMDGWITLIHVFGFFIVSSTVFDDALWKSWWRTFLLGVALVSGAALVQLIKFLSLNAQGLRLDGTFGNAIYLANYMLFAIPITVWQLLTTKHVWMRVAYSFLALLEVVILFYTETRGAFIGIFVAAVVASVWWFIDTQKTHTKENTKKGAVIALSLLVLFGASFFFARNTPLIQNNATLHRLASVFSANEFKTRFTIWTMAEHGASERPLLGWGQEGFNYVFNKYYDTSMYQQEVWFDRAHNAYLDWLIAGGIPGFLLFLVFLGCLLTGIYRSSLPKEQKILLFSAVLAYSISALSIFDNLFTYVPLLAIAAYVQSKEGRASASGEKIGVITGPVFKTVLTMVVAGTTLVSVWTINAPAILSAQALIQAIQPQQAGAEYNLELFKRALSQKTFASQEIREQLIIYTNNVVADPQVKNETKNAFANLAITEMGKSLSEMPRDARLHSMMSSLYMMVGNKEGALKEIDAALTLSPKKQTLYLQKGSLLWQFNDLSDAREAFHTAYVLDPSFKDTAAYDAAGVIVAGDTSYGFGLLTSVFGTTTVNNEAVIRAYYKTGHFDELLSVERLRADLSHGAVNDRFTIVAVLAAAGKKEEANQELDAILLDHPEVKEEGEQLRASLFSVPQK